jgi:hypothetical protein
VGVLPAGTICGHRWQLAGKVSGEPVVAVQYFATVTSTPWPETWPRPASDTAAGLVYRITGRPDMRMQLYFDPQSGEDGLNSSIPFTAMAAVNAIPEVIKARPGILTQPLHGPSVVTRQARIGRDAEHAPV